MSNTELSPEQNQANMWFARLRALLVDRKLPCENGPARVCEVDEFMFMQEGQGIGRGCGFFKHRDTRNYLIVRKTSNVGTLDTPHPSGFELFVPFTTSAFHLGFFDKL